jgi:quercetin dioxygenase-like cupin family protein
MNENRDAFFVGRQTPREPVGEGLVRQIFGYNDAIMMARVEFVKDAVGAVHSHPHTQVSYVESGEFDVYIDGEQRRLGPGDSFFVGPSLDHGAVCREAGVLIDVFSPAREDFLDEGKT